MTVNVGSVVGNAGLAAARDAAVPAADARPKGVRRGEAIRRDPRLDLPDDLELRASCGRRSRVVVEHPDDASVHYGDGRLSAPVRRHHP